MGPWKEEETERIGAGEARGLGASANLTSPLPCRVVLVPVAAEWYFFLCQPRGGRTPPPTIDACGSKEELELCEFYATTTFE